MQLSQNALEPLRVCACCLAPATLVREERSTRESLLFRAPYCDQCFGHREALSTRVLSAAAASVVLALSLTAMLPLAFDWPSAVVLLVSLAGALLPRWILQLWQPPVSAGHASSGAAAWWTPKAELVLANRAFAELLAEQHQTTLSAGPRAQRPSAWTAAGVVCGLVAFPFFSWMYHPQVRVLNLGDEPITIWIDGSQEARVEPSSSESREAGVTLRVKLGQRRLEARSATGRILDSRRVGVQSASEHLYAPGSDGYCFWLESTHYGRTLSKEPSREPLAAEEKFWRVPVSVDSWFAANPPADADDRRSTGGVLTALRQAPCTEASPERGSPSGTTGE